MIKITIDQLEDMVNYLKRNVEYNNMMPYVIVSIDKMSNGKEAIEFEQPCYYAECFSSYWFS